MSTKSRWSVAVVTGLLLWAAAVTGVAAGEELRVLRRSWNRTPRPALPVPTVAAAPKLDGDLDEAVWRRASSVSSFLPARDGPSRRAFRDAAPVGTQLLAARDRDTLFLAVRCAEPSADLVRSSPRKRDQSLAADDTVEIYLTDSDQTPRFLHFSVNADGALRDAKGHFGRSDDDTDYDTAGSVHAQRGPTGWTVELAIPLAELRFTDGGVPVMTGQPAALWAAVVRRRWAGAGLGASSPELLSWTGSPGPERLGRLVLVPLSVRLPELPSSDVAVGSAESPWQLSADAGAPARLAVSVVITGQLAESATESAVGDLPVGKAVTLTQRWSAQTEGLGWLSLVLTEPGRVGQLTPFREDAEPLILACVQRPVIVAPITAALDQLGRRLSESSLPEAERAELSEAHRRLAVEMTEQIRSCAGRAFGAANDRAWATLAEQHRGTLTPLHQRLDGLAEQATQRLLESGSPPTAIEPTAELGPLVERWAHAGGAVLERSAQVGPARAAEQAARPTTLREQLDGLARAAGLRLESAESGERLRLLPSGDGEGRAPIYHGPFRLQPISLSVARPLGRVPVGGGASGSTATLRVSLEWEPGLWVTAIAAEPEVLSLAEESGQPLRSAAGDARVRSLVAQPSGLRRDWRLAIAAPAAGGGRLRSLQLGVELTLAAVREHVVWSPQQLAQPGGVAPVWLGNVFVRSSAIGRVAGRHTVMLEIDGEQADDAQLEPMTAWPALPEIRVVWLDRHGQPMPVTLDRERLDRRTLLLTVSVPGSSDGREPELGQLRIESPRRLLQHRLTLSVGDLVLP